MNLLTKPSQKKIVSRRLEKKKKKLNPAYTQRRGTQLPQRIFVLCTLTVKYARRV